MPGRDGTGPSGKGPMTGRGLGFCILQFDEFGKKPVAGFAGLQGRPMYEAKQARRRQQCRKVMEQDQAGKGQVQAAGADLAAVASERIHRQEPAEGKAGVAAEGRAAVGEAWAVAVRQASQIEEGGTTMPAGDGTGPMGMGPMTGRAAGFCAGFGMPGYMNPGFGRGMGMGRGRGAGRGGGRGWRNMFYATGLTGWQRAAGWPMGGTVSPYAAAPTREQELDALKSQAEYFESTLGDIRKRLQELEAENTSK